MACERLAVAIRAHALGAPLAADAAAHLAACPVCRATFDADRRVLTAVDDALAEVMSAAPSAHFVSRLRAHVNAAPRPWIPRQWQIAAGVAALAVLTVALIVPRIWPGPFGA